MKLKVAAGNRALSDGDYLVVGTRALLELELEGVEANAPADAAWQIGLSLSGQPLPSHQLDLTAAEQGKPVPGLAFRRTLRIRPFPDSVWRTEWLVLELRDARQEKVAALRVLLIPSPHARAARACLLLGLVLSLLIAWPAFLATPANLLEFASKAAFGAPLLALLTSALAKKLKGLFEGGAQGPPDADWRFFGIQPLLFPSALVSVACVAAIALLVHNFIVIYVNHSGHDVHLNWSGRENELFAADTATIRVAADARTLLENAWPGSSALQRYCLAGVDSDCPRSSWARSSSWDSLLGLAPVAELTCREVVWSQIPRHLALAPEPVGAELVKDRVLVKTSPTDCTASPASVLVDADSFDGSEEPVSAPPAAAPGPGSAPPPAKPATRLYRFAFDPEQPAQLPALQAFVEVQVHLPESTARALLPLRVESSGPVPGPFLSTRVELRSGDGAAPPLVVRVPALPTTHRFELSIAPAGNAPWGVLSCFPRGNSRLELWLLPLEDSAVASFRVEFSDGVVSNWRAAGTDSGEASPIVAVCLPDWASKNVPSTVPAASAAPRVYLEVAARGGDYDSPQLGLPPALGNSVLRISTGAAQASQRLGTVTCNYTAARRVRLLRAPGLRPPNGSGEFSLYDPIVSPDCKLARLPQGVGDARAVWNGTGTPLVCLPEGSRSGAESTSDCHPVQPDWGSSACGWRAQQPERACSAPAPPVCRLDRFGAPRRAPCECQEVKAKAWLTVQEQRAVVERGCNLDTALACKC